MIIISQPSITMPSPYSNTSFFDDPSDIEMEYLSLPKQPLCIKKSLWSIRSTFLHNRTPVKELPGIPQLALYDIPITPTIPIDPLFPPQLQPKPPYHLGEDISEIGMGTRFVGIEARDPQYYWITCQMDNTGIRFAVRVDRCLVIDPDPQNMSSWIDWALVWTSIRTHSLVLKIVSVDGDWVGRSEGDVRERHEKGKDPQVWRKEMTWNPEDSTPS